MEWVFDEQCLFSASCPWEIWRWLCIIIDRSGLICLPLTSEMEADLENFAYNFIF